MSDELSPEVFDAVCRQADQAARAQERLAQANTEAKNELLLAIADALDGHAADIEAANALDMLESKENGMDAGKLDRLLFDVPRATARERMAQGAPKACVMWPPCPIRSAKSCADTTCPTVCALPRRAYRWASSA